MQKIILSKHARMSGETGCLDFDLYFCMLQYFERLIRD